MHHYAVRVIQFIDDKHVTKERLLADEELQWYVTTPLSVIGEHASRITDSFRELHSEIPWIKIRGLRNRLVHEYSAINWNIIADAIFEDIPKLADQLKDILKNNSAKRSCYDG